MVWNRKSVSILIEVTVLRKTLIILFAIIASITVLLKAIPCFLLELTLSQLVCLDTTVLFLVFICIVLSIFLRVFSKKERDEKNNLLKGFPDKKQ